MYAFKIFLGFTQGPTNPPPIVLCTPMVVLTADSTECTTTVSEAAHLAMSNAGSSSPQSPLTLSLQPAPSFGNLYVFTQGQTYTVSLVGTNSGGTAMCESFITVKAVPAPIAVCAAAVTLPAISQCAAHPDTATLLGLVDAGSTGGAILLLMPSARQENTIMMTTTHGHSSWGGFSVE